MTQTRPLSQAQLTGTGGTAARVIGDWLSDPNNAKGRGVKADGTTDDTAAMQAFVTALAANGGIGTLPPGVINIATTRINIPVNAKPFLLRGAGMGVTVIKRMGAFNAGPIALTTPIGVTLEDFTVDVNVDGYPVTGSNFAHGISFSDGSHVRIRRVEVLNHTGTGIQAFQSSSTNTIDVVFEDCRCDGNPRNTGNLAGNGFLIAGYTDSGLLNCRAVNCPGIPGTSPGIGLQLKQTGERNWIRGGYAERCAIGVGVGHDSATTEGSRYTQVVGVTIYRCGAGVVLGDTRNGTQVSNIMIDMALQGGNAIGLNNLTTGAAFKNIFVVNHLWTQPLLYISSPTSGYPSVGNPTNNKVEVSWYDCGPAGSLPAGHSPILMRINSNALGASGNALVVQNSSYLANLITSEVVDDNSGNSSNSISAGNYQYNQQPVAAAAYNSSITGVGGISAVTVAGGGHYTGVPTLVLPAPSLGTGTQATAVALMGMFGSLPAITNGGAGYTVGDPLTFPQGGGGTGLQFTVSSVDGGGAITAVTVANFGVFPSTFSMPAAATGGTGTGATFTFDFTISGATITDQGSGYLPFASTAVTTTGGGQLSAPALTATIAANLDLGGVSTSVKHGPAGKVSLSGPLAGKQLTSKTLVATSTNATARRLVADGTGTFSTVASIAAPANSVQRVRGWVTARDSANPPNIASWSVDFTLKRGSNLGSTSAKGATGTAVDGSDIAPDISDAAMSACAIRITADTFYGSAMIQGVGLAATTITWSFSPLCAENA